MRWPFALLLTATVAAPAFSDVITLNPSKDNTLYFDPTGNLSNGIGWYFFAGETRQVGTRRGLIEFDLSVIPAGSIVNSAVLRLHVSRANSGSRAFQLRRALREWGEGGSDAGATGGQGTSAQTNDATWLHTFYNGSTWENPGGDFAPAASASANVSNVGFYNWFGTGVTADVQSWVNAPGQNHGWGLIGPEGGTASAKRFDSRETTVPEWVPTLTVNFTPIPEPAGAAALLAAVCVLRRRGAR